MPSMNRIQIMGHVGFDPKLREAAGKTVCDFTVAVTRKWKSGEEKREETTWFKVTVWDWLADRSARDLRKGDGVFVEGRLSLRNYQGRDGVDKYSLDIAATNVIKISAKGSNGGDGGGYTQSHQPKHEVVGVGAYVKQEPVQSSTEDDSIPF